MSILFYLFVVVVCVAWGQKVSENFEDIEREQLAFIERSIVDIYRHATFPEIFQLRNNDLASCGCEFNTQQIYWGSEIGVYCKNDIAMYQDVCGARCFSPRGHDILLLCPEGWEADCEAGCVPPRFDTVQDRSDFLERNVDLIIQYGFDYLLIDPEYAGACGCDDRGIRAIRYGSEIGFDCVAPEESVTPECNGHRGCQNGDEESLTIFCPAGHAPNCAGCRKTLDAQADAGERYEWMVNVMTGYIRETKDVLGLLPSASKTAECGCVGALQPINYGSLIGHYCNVRSQEDIQPTCGHHSLCQNNDGDLVMHFCPGGFVADCDEGCGFAWVDKSEL